MLDKIVPGTPKTTRMNVERDMFICKLNNEKNKAKQVFGHRCVVMVIYPKLLANDHKEAH